MINRYESFIQWGREKVGRRKSPIIMTIIDRQESEAKRLFVDCRKEGHSVSIFSKSTRTIHGYIDNRSEIRYFDYAINVVNTDILILELGVFK